jgi:predicted  nucleic acid-binding Zn-ribbon protein
MSQPFKLYRLQQMDSQLDQVRARLEQIAAALREDTALRLAQEEANQSAQALEQERKALRRAEETVHSQRLKIEQTESTLYGGKVRNPKELQDLQNEVAALKRYISVLEDRQLEAMLAVEEAEAFDATTVAALDEVRAQLAKQNSSLAGEQLDLQKELERLKNERETTAATIEAGDLSLYEQIRLQRRGVAVARVTQDKSCSACGSTLNATLLHAARSPSQLTRCDVCGRILYGG